MNEGMHKKLENQLCMMDHQSLQRFQNILCKLLKIHARSKFALVQRCIIIKKKNSFLLSIGIFKKVWDKN